MTATIPSQVIYSVQVAQLLKNHGYNSPELNLPESEWYGIDVLFKSDNVVIINGRVSSGHLKIQFVGEEQTATGPHPLLKPMQELFGIPDLVLNPKMDVVFNAGRCMPSVKYQQGILHEIVAAPNTGVADKSPLELKPNALKNDAEFLESLNQPAPSRTLTVEYAEDFEKIGEAGEMTYHAVNVTRS